MSVEDPNPLSRPDVYSMSVGAATVAATEHWVDPDLFPDLPNGWQPITNSAGDRIDGLKKRQAEITLTIKGNRSSRPFDIARDFVNKVNATPWQGGEKLTWLCTGLSAQEATEIVGEEVLNYWQVSFSFAYREEGWYVITPNVGLYAYYEIPTTGEGSVAFPPTFPVSGSLEKRRITVSDGAGNYRPSGTPLPLKKNGRLETALDANGNIVVTMLYFQVYKPVDFANYFALTAPGN